jgi:iron complex outermembrane receptor protein
LHQSLRSDVVRMNTGNVAGYNSDTTATGSASYYADATEFNSRDHHRLDSNFEMTAQARYEPNPTFTF